MNKCGENKPGYANIIEKTKIKDIEHVEMSGMSGWFILQPHGEILNKPIGWLTTHATLSNNSANHRARY